MYTNKMYLEPLDILGISLRLLKDWLSYFSKSLETAGYGKQGPGAMAPRIGSSQLPREQGLEGKGRPAKAERAPTSPAEEDQGGAGRGSAPLCSPGITSLKGLQVAITVRFTGCSALLLGSPGGTGAHSVLAPGRTARLPSSARGILKGRQEGNPASGPSREPAGGKRGAVQWPPGLGVARRHFLPLGVMQRQCCG